MALGTDHVISTEIGNFIPELWSDEVVASRKSNLVMVPLVRMLNHRGKKGDTVKIPTPSRASASTKSATTQVTLIEHGTDTGISVVIDQHKEYSRLIEDFADVQALASLRRFYTDDAGYALAKEEDSAVIVEMLRKSGASITYTASTNKLTTASTFPTLYEGDGTTWDEGATTNISDAGIRAFVRLLDLDDAPQAGRHLVVHPYTKEDMLGISRFSEQAFVGEGSTIRNGYVGDVYGVDVYVSNRMPVVEDSGATADNVLNVMFQSDALVIVEQLGIRTQTQYKQEWLGTLFTADVIFGTKILREGHIVPIVTQYS